MRRHATKPRAGDLRETAMSAQTHELFRTLLDRKALEQRVALRRSAIYARMDPKSPYYDPTFPKPVPIGGQPGKPTAVRWLAGEVDAWIESRIAERDAA